MTQWWELAIPAGAAIGGGFVGAWWQGRNSKAIFALQLDENDKVREAERKYEAKVRFLDVRREAYASLMSNWSNLDYARVEAIEAVARAEALGPVDTSDQSSVSHAHDVHLEAARASREAQRFSEAVISAMETVYLLAPPEVRNVLPTSSGPNVEGARDRFFKAARCDLGIPNELEPT